MELIWFLGVGLVSGWLASVLLRNGGYGVVGDIVIGALGALLGGFVYASLGGSIEGGAVGCIGVATLGSVGLLALLRLIKQA